jgi:3-deoxy-manno-octulosonate cytidylyltransferase (CMP-KDO synthetase)
MLASATGRPLVQHVVDRVRQCRRVSRVIVAADDPRIITALTPFGTECMLTDPGHPSGTDRVGEVAQRLGADASAIINVQGDEPEIEPQVVDGLDELLEAGEFEMCTAATPLPAANAADPNLVKVVISRTARAMYFSRSPIPFDRDGAKPAYYLHVGVYAYQRPTLIRLAGWKPTPCETAEKLEQLRALEHDVPIGVMVIERAAHGIDTPQQYQAFVQRFQQPATSN